jgi:hypothetical protein
MVSRYAQKPNVYSMVLDAIGSAAQQQAPEVGHAWVSVIKKTVVVNSFNVNESYAVSTLSYWPNAAKPDNQNSNDVNNTFNSLGLTTSTGLKTGIRKAKISEPKYFQLINSNSTQYGCQVYAFDNPTGSNPCTCVTKTMRVWNNLTGENWTGFFAPDELADSINTKNNLQNINGYANNGNIIQ